MREFTSAAIITVAWSTTRDGKLIEEHVKCVVPASWLWSADALASAFTKLRAGLLPKPAEGREDEPWDSFHIARVVEDTNYYVQGDYECQPTPIRLSSC
jgi:hypothetical protein